MIPFFVGGHGIRFLCRLDQHGQWDIACGGGTYYSAYNGERPDRITGLNGKATTTTYNNNKQVDVFGTFSFSIVGKSERWQNARTPHPISLTPPLHHYPIIHNVRVQAG